MFQICTLRNILLAVPVAAIESKEGHLKDFPRVMLINSNRIDYCYPHKGHTHIVMGAMDIKITISFKEFTAKLQHHAIHMMENTIDFGLEPEIPESYREQFLLSQIQGSKKKPRARKSSKDQKTDKFVMSAKKENPS